MGSIGAFEFPIHVPDDCPFGMYNLPLGIYSIKGQTPRAGTAVGQWIIDLDNLLQNGVFKDTFLAASLKGVFLQPVLNDFASLPLATRQCVRQTIIENLSNPDSLLFNRSKVPPDAFVPLEEAEMHMPMQLTDYTDFYSSLVHAEMAGKAMDVPVPKAFWEYPMAYNGRVSSVRVSGTNVIRPKGFFLSTPDDKHVKLQPSRELDFEMELGCFIAHPIAPGEVVSARDAWKHVFGYVLLNDWSARDTQKYEMHPFGPFHSKSFLTSISPWVVTPDALRGSLTTLPVAANTLAISGHLQSDPNNHAGYDIEFSVSLSRKGNAPGQIVRSYLKDSHWDSLQMIAYQSSSGCGLHTGDLLGSGTNSSPTPESRDPSSPVGCGCLFEAVASKTPIEVANQTVSWLEDGDLVTMEGWFTTPDRKRAGFGPLTGLVVPSKR